MFILLTILLIVLPLGASQILFLEWSFNWFNTFTFSFLILIDYISTVFWFTVLWITLRVYVFRGSYMINDQYYLRFHGVLSIFVISMLLLISRPRFLRRLLGWDGLGLSSYLLVIYYSSSKAYNSGIITALTNRIGDSLILILIGFMICDLRWSIPFLAKSASLKYWLIVFGFACFTKRAQVPFSAWLPAAMAAPTPVSALVHSSTLVTAGVYLLIRFDYGFADRNTLNYFLLVGVVTTLMARTTALVEVDLKKIVALSTLRQLGVIVSLVGLGMPQVRFLHLAAHAFFKALIFVATGGIIHASRSGQDLRWIGGIVKFFRRTKRIVLLANLRLRGLPFISAFFRKEIYLEMVRRGLSSLGLILLFYLSIFLTLIYRLRFMSLYYRIRGKIFSLNFCLDQEKEPTQAMLLLTAPALTGGLFLRGYGVEMVLPLSTGRPYILVFRVIITLFLILTKSWTQILLQMVSKLVLFIITMWGLVVRISLIGCQSTRKPPKLLMFNDRGYHNKIIISLIKVPISRLSIGILNKFFSSSLIIILVWFLCFLIYYINNMLLRQLKLEIAPNLRGLTLGF